MNKARARLVQVMSCDTYTSNALGRCTCALHLTSGIIIAAWLLLGWESYWWWQKRASDSWMLAAIALFAYRLTIAYRSYLQFRHAFIPIFTSQFLVALFVFTAILTIAMWQM